MRYDQIVRARDGQARRIVHLDEVVVPKAWPILMVMQDQAEGHGARTLTTDDVEQMQELWYLCQDLLKHIKRITVEPRT